MSIEEVIRKYMNLANDERSRRIMMKKNHPSITNAEITSFEAEYRQIANWLQELKERREKERRIEIGDIAPVVEPKPISKLSVELQPSDQIKITAETLESVRKLAEAITERLPERLPEIIEGIKETMNKLVEAFTPEAINEYLRRKEESK